MKTKKEFVKKESLNQKIEDLKRELKELKKPYFIQKTVSTNYPIYNFASDSYRPGKKSVTKYFNSSGVEINKDEFQHLVKLHEQNKILLQKKIVYYQSVLTEVEKAEIQKEAESISGGDGSNKDFDRNKIAGEIINLVKSDKIIGKYSLRKFEEHLTLDHSTIGNYLKEEKFRFILYAMVMDGMKIERDELIKNRLRSFNGYLENNYDKNKSVKTYKKDGNDFAEISDFKKGKKKKSIINYDESDFENDSVY